MRIANARARLVLLTARGGVDVERASEGRFGPDPAVAFARWSAQVFGIGLNYRGAIEGSARSATAAS
jgi:hypothetical protein